MAPSTERLALPRMLRLRTASIKMLSALQSGTEDVVMLWKAEEILNEAEVECRGEGAIRSALQIRTTQLEAENLEQAQSIMRLCEDMRYIQGIARRGLGELPDNEPIRASILRYVKQLEAQRDTAYGYGRDGGEPPWMK